MLAHFLSLEVGAPSGSPYEAIGEVLLNLKLGGLTQPSCNLERTTSGGRQKSSRSQARSHIDLEDRGRAGANITIFPSPYSRLGKSSPEDPPRLAQGTAWLMISAMRWRSYG